MQGDVGFFCLILDQMAHRVQASVYRAAFFIGGAKVLPHGFFLIMRDVDRVRDQLVHALILGGGDRYDRHAEQRFELVDVHGAAVGGQLIHDIQRDDDRGVHLEQLHGQIEVALDIGRVDDVDNRAGLFVQHKAARDDLFIGIGRHRVDAGQVGDEGVFVTLDDAVLAVDGYAGEVADMLIGACQLIEERGFAAVLVAD